ncbi:hypothetical protein NEF87_003458 [Candidatus Lokiarchaeum ossiferum]|uniref:4-vinyl reductase 4VR domain-containing protein n=1 Tax=Candidatus Lokiarchaeum ossiferum TaxID=2951803 RepID=A0ABY6HUH4_9ARCH|nr:hypothetical protein NEF87_003458 [Candidatus Lokiarchaeum sp. B-35]
MMKAQDFNFEKDLKFNMEKGMTTFKDTRLVIFDTEAIGLLRKMIFDEIGKEKARKMFLKFGYQHGYADFMQMELNYKFDSEIDLLASGPVIHTWEGVVQATPKEVKIDRKKGEIYFTGVWNNSYEAEQHLMNFGEDSEPVCWSLMGYASGWCSAFMGKKIIAIEPICMGKGDDHCEWEIKPEEDWGEEAKPYIEALKEFKV